MSSQQVDGTSFELSPEGGAAASFPALPKNFRWSAATAAFQIEGARGADGRGRSIWDDFVDTPGRVLDGSTAEPGPDSYHRSVEDAQLLASLGVDRYRFSISWVRVQPEVGGPVSSAGISYYDRLVDHLLERGVTPFPTLYHWDLPSALEADGGWLNRSTVDHFSEYVETVAAALGDRVQHWYTINEPVSTALQGYAIGELAPGRSLLFDSLPTVHHQLLAHGRAQQILRAHGASEVGIANNHTQVIAASESQEDRLAAGLYDLVHNRIFADPLLLGHYPEFPLPNVEFPVQDGDLELISAPSDFYGLNFYNPTTIQAAPEDSPLPFLNIPTAGAEHTGFGELWPIAPSTLTDLLRDTAERYGQRLPPIIISENGASFNEPASVTGVLDDQQRIAYLSGHIHAVSEAVRLGVNVAEYTTWSLLDNFEWADGFTQRFGLVHVDHATSERTPKASFHWYKNLIEATRAGREQLHP